MFEHKAILSETGTTTQFVRLHAYVPRHMACFLLIHGTVDNYLGLRIIMNAIGGIIAIPRTIYVKIIDNVLIPFL